MKGSYSPPKLDRIWGICGSYYNIHIYIYTPKAIVYLLKGGYAAKLSVTGGKALGSSGSRREM